MQTTWFLRSGAKLDLTEKAVNGQLRYCSNLVVISADKATISARHECGRCDGAGSSQRWAATGFTCFQCQGSGIHSIKNTDLYSEAKLAALNVTHDKRLVKLAAKKQAKLDAYNAECAAQAAERIHAARAQFPEAVNFLESYEGDHEFLNSVKDKVTTGKPFTEAMAAAVLKVRNSMIQRQNWDELVASIEEKSGSAEAERQVVSGYILSAQWRDSMSGPVLKLLVLDDRGFKFWCSPPKSIRKVGPRDDDNYLDLRAMHKAHVRFTTTLGPSDDDPSFFFGTRPGKDIEYTPWGGETLKSDGKS